MRTFVDLQLQFAIFICSHLSFLVVGMKFNRLSKVNKSTHSVSLFSITHRMMTDVGQMTRMNLGRRMILPFVAFSLGDFLLYFDENSQYHSYAYGMDRPFIYGGVTQSFPF